MKTVRGEFLALAVILVIVTVVLVQRHFERPRSNQQPPATPVAVMQVTRPHPSKEAESAHLQTNASPGVKGFTTLAPDMTLTDRAKLARDFEHKYKPAVAKWFAAFAGRVPFAESDFTLDKFHSRLGDYMYTFMIGDITFTIQDSKLGIKVSYLMTGDGAQQLNSTPNAGFVPNLHVPVTKEEVLRMVKADSGVEFNPNEVIVKPTAAASVLNGGAFVYILPEGTDPNNSATHQMQMVFGADGKLVTYARDPAL